MSARFAIFTALLLGLSGGAAFAQLEDAPTGFYADPVLPDPPATVAHAYPASTATADVAIVTPVGSDTPQAAIARPHNNRPSHDTACTTLNPCAISTPAARG